MAGCCRELLTLSIERVADEEVCCTECLARLSAHYTLVVDHLQPQTPSSYYVFFLSIWKSMYYVYTMVTVEQEQRMSTPDQPACRDKGHEAAARSCLDKA